MIKLSAPIYSMEISEDEKKAAGALRTNFEGLLAAIHDALEHVQQVRNALEPIKEPADMQQLKSQLMRYQTSTKQIFASVWKSWQDSMRSYADLKSKSGSEMQQIVEVINVQSGELYQNVSDLLRTLDNIDDLKFGESFLGLSDQVIGKLTTLVTIVRDQLFRHIDYDILGTIRLGTANISLSKRGYYGIH